jgi:RHS repeat-associated protein
MNVKGNDSMTRARTFALVALLCLCAFRGFSAEPAAEAQGARRQYLVVLNTGKGAAPLTESDVATLGGHIDFKMNDRLAVTLPEAAVDALRAHAGVKFVQRVVDSPEPSLPPAPEPSSASPAHAASTGSPRIASDTTPPVWSSGEMKYDAAGNIYAVGTAAAPSSDGYQNVYTYDATSRLKSATVKTDNVNDVEKYDYDEYGNLKERKVNDVIVDTNSVQPSTNRLTAAQYDNAGNLNQYGADYYYYDPFNNLREYDHQYYQDLYVYDVDDNRLAVRQGDTWTWSLRGFDGKVLRQYKSSDSIPQMPWLWVQNYVYRNGSLLGAERAQEEGGRRHYHLDQLGSPRLITGRLGELASHHDFRPFGLEATSIRQETAGGFDREEPMKFTGAERDFAAGTDSENTNYIDHMYARSYRAIWSRWLSVDPIGGNAKRPQTWNRYSYALNNPLGLTDPAGLDPCTVTWNGQTFPSECITVNGSYEADYIEWLRFNRELDRALQERRVLEQRARRGDEFAMMLLHYPASRFGIQPTHAEFFIVAPLTGLLKSVGMSAGELGLDAVAEETSEAATDSFFDGATFEDLEMKLSQDHFVIARDAEGAVEYAGVDKFHDFPESVMAFEDAGTVTSFTGGDGATVQMLKIPGEYGGKEGVFEFIKNSSNEITHYFFRPNVH